MIQFTWGTWNGKIHRSGKWNEIHQGLQEGKYRVIFGFGVSIWDDENILKMDSSDGCTSLWMFITPLNYTPKNI